jgi:dipeptidyl aminopeptidase/acylaminoacyl peptidase
MNVVAVSSRNELALRRGFTLLKAPLASGAPRPLESRVSSADWSPDGTQLAVTRGGGTINPVEYPIGKVIYKSTQAVSDVRISPLGDLLAFREGGAHGHIVVIDTEGHEKVRSAYHDGLEAPVWKPDGREVWFTVSIPHGRIPVLALDLSGWERTVLTDPTLRLKDISRDGRVLMATEDTTYSIHVRAPGSPSERNLTWYNWSLLDDISSDGRTIVFTEGGESDPENGWSTYVRPTDGSPPQHFDDVIYSRLSPDGKWLVGLSDDKNGLQIKLVPTGAGQAQLVTHGPEGHNIVGWLQDSSGIVYWDHNPAKPEAPDRIWLATLDGRPPKPVTPEGWFGIGMGPKGNGVLAQTSALNDPRTFLFSLDGREQILLPGLSDGKWVPIGWDPDGKRVWALPQGLAVPMRVFRVDPMTGNAEPWRELGGQVDPAGLTGSRRVAFSADGESYAYNYSRKLSTLYLVEGLR